VAESPALLAGVNVRAGQVTNEAVAQTFRLELHPAR
jgi:alanine dehydrogenase